MSVIKLFTFASMRFKKGTSLFLAMLLLVSNLGLAFNVHYCEGKIAAVSSVYNVEEVCEKPIVVAEKECCAKPEVSHKSCCDDKVVDLQDDADQIVVKTFSFAVAAPFIIQEFKPTVFTFIPVVKHSEPAAYYCESHAPPLYKQYRQLIFYA